MDTKKVIRNRYLEKRRQLMQELWERNSHRIFLRLKEHPLFLQSEYIYSYVDYQKEVDTHELIAYALEIGKKVAVPKIMGNHMEFYYLSSLDSLKPGFHGIPEPDGAGLATESKALMIMPGVAFDPACNRIGYGKGYYDRYLHAHPEHPTIALAFELQITELIEADFHDIQPNLIITEERIYE